MYDKDFEKEFDDDYELAADGADETPAEVTTPLSTQVASTPLDLAKMGLTEIAYIRRAVINDTPVWSIHSAAGHPIGAAESFDQAWAAVKQHDLEPVRVH